MNTQVIPIAALKVEVSKQRKRQAPKGRRVEAGALDDVQRLLGQESRQRELLIEHLHKIQDSFGHLSAAHLAALAQEMRLAQTEVFEVASFYHHFDIVKEGEHGAAGADGACVRRPVLRDGRCRRPAAAAARLARHATCASSRRPASAAASRRRRRWSGRILCRMRVARRCWRQVERQRHAPPARGPHRLRRLPGRGRLRAAAGLRLGRARCRIRDQDARGLGPARPRRCRVSRGPQVAHRARRSRRRA